LEVPLRVQELLEDLHDEGPQLDRLAGGLPVVRRVRRQRDVELARRASVSNLTAQI
jgi:hypothetical protein